jgi:two-component system, NtrC family, sensor histidine kinase PilS
LDAETEDGDESGAPGAPLVIMQQQERQKRLEWFLPLRLATYVILMAIVVFWMRSPKYLELQIILYSVFTLGFTMAMGLEKRFRLESLVQFLIGCQFLFEIAIEGGVIYATGNVNSPFSALFLLTIVSAALAYRMVGTLVMASLVSLAYAFIIWLGFSQTNDADLNMQALQTIFATQDFVFYSIFLHILIFFLVAFISGYLAERLSSQNKELADTSMALRRARLETDDILRHLNSGLLTIDAQGNIIYFNRAAEKILGYREEDVRGMPCQDVFADRMPRLAQCLTDGLRFGVDHPRKEIDILNGNRQSIPLGMSISVLMDEEKMVRGLIAIFTDLTDAKALESKARAADRLAAVGELSASIAHEIRNPLAAISGSVEVLSRDLSVSNEHSRLMELIVKESHRLSKILSDFLLYARIDRPRYDKVELCHVITDCIEILRHHASYHEGIQIDLHADSAMMYIIGDEDLIKQVIMNLAINACEAFDGKPGRLMFQVSEERHSQMVELVLEDNGPGIPKGDRDRIFQPFFSTKKHGTGLGLSIVHRICTTLRFILTVDSVPTGGTRFTLGFRSFSAEPSRRGMALGQPVEIAR